MYVSQGTRINDFLGMFGIAGGQIGAKIDMLAGNPLGVLMNLHDAAMEASMGRGTSGMERQMLGQMGQGYSPYPSPLSMMPFMPQLCGGGYQQCIDLGGNAPTGFLGLFSQQRQGAAQMESLLKSNPLARMAFEQSIGGRIIDFGSGNDGRMRIERFPTNIPQMALFANPLAAQAAQMMAGFGGIAGPLGLGANPFMGAMLGGFGGIMSSLMGGGGFGFGGLGGGFGPLGALAGLGGFGGFGPMNGDFGSFNPLARPGLINNNGRFEEVQHQQQVDSVLHDPSLTVEDRVMLMLMLICKKMDKDIQQQSEYINRIQQQQGGKGADGSGSKKGGGGGKGGKGKLMGPIGKVAGTAIGGPAGGKIGSKLGQKIGGGMGGGGGGMGGGFGIPGMGGSGGPFGAPGQEGAPSIDIETKKLERMVQKRSQMFDMLKGIMEKYDATSKGVTQSLGR